MTYYLEVDQYKCFWQNLTKLQGLFSLPHITEPDSYLLWTIPGLHGVSIEESYDGTLLSLPEFLVNLSKQEQWHGPRQVTKIIQSPDAECLSLEQVFILNFNNFWTMDCTVSIIYGSSILLWENI